MNASTGLFYLEHAYERDVKKATEANQSDTTVTGKIVKQADRICKQRHGNYYSSAYVLCFSEEQARLIEQYPQMDVSVKMPEPELYRHEFTSPLWSPDFAGWSLLASGAVVVVIIARVVTKLILKGLLRYRYRSI